MSTRTVYQQINAEQFTAGLNEVGLRSESFAWLTGADHRRVRRWLSGDEPSIPHWVALVVTLLTLPGAGPLATALARKMVIREEEATE